YYQKSLKIYQNLENTLGIAKIYNNLGVLSHNQGDFIQALEYYQKSLELRQQVGDKEGMGKT
ncbi:MAG: tetratricopeptide repeat protein, partial [Bacteroidales bacterium]|nr:tetratricopeptide repeat protein [Bacteroidales bacterium]